METTRFEIGRTYGTRSIGDHDCIFQMVVVKRTPKMIYIERHGEISRKKVTVWNGVEQISMGNYSMAASWSADLDENGDTMAQRERQEAAQAEVDAEVPAAAAIQHEAGAHGAHHFTITARGVEYTATVNARGEWELHSRRLALGRWNTGTYRHFDSAEELAAACPAMAGLPAVWQLHSGQAPVRPATVEALADSIAAAIVDRVRARIEGEPEPERPVSARDRAAAMGWGIVDGGR